MMKLCCVRTCAAPPSSASCKRVNCCLLSRAPRTLPDVSSQFSPHLRKPLHFLWCQERGPARGRVGQSLRKTVRGKLQFHRKQWDKSRRTPPCLSMTMMPPPAGIVYTHNEGGVASCVREEERPPTPAAICKWRRSGTSLSATQEVDPKMSFGSGGVKASDHVADIWRQVCAHWAAAHARKNEIVLWLRRTKYNTFVFTFLCVPSLGRAAGFMLAVLYP